MVFLGGHFKGQGCTLSSPFLRSDAWSRYNGSSTLASMLSHEDKKRILGVIEPEDLCVPGKLTELLNSSPKLPVPTHI